MTEEEARQELRPHLRDERSPDDSAIVVRGGPTRLTQPANHVQRSHQAFVFDGQPLWGVSVFCALDERMSRVPWNWVAAR